MDKIKNTDRHYYLAKAYFTAGMYGPAVSEFEKALKFSPEFANIHYDLAITYEKMKLYGNAAKEYNIALDINPHYSAAKEALSKLLSGNRDEKLKIKKRIPVKKILRYVSICFAAAVVVSAAAIFSKPPPPSITYFSVPSVHPSGITISKDEIWICDWFSQKLYRHKMDTVLTLIKFTKLDDVRPSGIASGKEELWVCDAFSRKIFKFDKKSLKQLGNFNSPSVSPSAIFETKDFLWTCDSSDDKIYKHEKDKNLTVIFSAVLSNPNPVGLYVKGKNIFIADADTSKVYRYFYDKKNKKISQLNTYEIPAFGDGSAKSRKISGLSMTSDDLFLTSEGTGEVYKIPFKMLKSK